MKFTNRKYQQNFILNEEEIDLSHLQPFIEECHITSDRSVILHIEISTHVFSSDWKEEEHAPELLIQDHCIKRSKHNRAFCLSRYEDSLELRKHLGRITGNTRYIDAGDGNYLLRDGDYYIFFRIYEYREKVIFLVKSAYRKKNRLGGRTLKLKNYLKKLNL